MADEIVLKIVVDSDLAGKTVGELKQDFKDLNKQLEQTQVGTEAYKKTLQSLGVVKGGLQDLKEQIKALNPEKQFAAIARLGSTVASGFAAAQGAAALFGSESQELMQVLVRVQAATALASGLQGLAGFVKALETARLAMIAFAASNPFTLILLAVTALGAGLYALTRDVEKESQAMKDARKVIEDYAKAHDQAKASVQELNAELLKEQGIISQAAVDTIKITNDKWAELDKASEDHLANIAELGKKFIDGQFRDRDEYQVAVLEAQEAYEQKRLDIEAVFAEKKKLQDEKRTQAEAAAHRREIAENDEREIKAEEDAEKRRVEKLKRIAEIEQEELARRQAFHNAVAQIEKQEAEKARAERNFNDELETQNEIRMFKMRKDYLQARLDAEITITQARIGLAQGFLGVATALAAKHKNVADALFVVDKALAIAGIVVSTQKEIAGYYANPTWSLLPDGGLALKTTQAIGAKIRAATSIATIIGTTIQKFMGGGSADLGGSATSVSAPNVSSPQSQQQTFDQQKGALVNTNKDGDFESFGNGGRMQGWQKVYVLETDITEKQNKIQVIESNAKY